MKSVLFILLLISSLIAGAAPAQSRFTPDSVSIEYAQCKGERAAADVLLINRGSSLEVVDLRFADSNRTWEIYDTTGGTSFIKGLLLFGGDTAVLHLRHKQIEGAFTHDWYRDTLVTSGAATSDTLLLNAHNHFADLKTDLVPLDLGIVVQGGVASRSFKIWNVGDASHIFNYTVSPGWTLEGLAIGDTLYPGDTINVSLVLKSTDVIGNFTTMIWIHGDCDDLGIVSGSRVKVVPAFAHWTIPSLADSATGCLRMHDYALTIRNESSTNTIVDSIQIIGQEQLWSINAPGDRNFILAPEASKTITLTRGIGATSTRLVIHSNKNGNDTLAVIVTPMFARPRIKNAIDTARLDLKPDQQAVYSIEVQNQGAGLYRLTDARLEGDSRWSVLGLDTISTIGLSKSLLLKLVFSGSNTAGDFPVKAFISGEPCDTLMTQVVVAHVAVLDVAESIKGAGIEVYPTVASTHVTIRTLQTTQYHVFDISGNEVSAGIAEAPATKLYVEALASGRYWIRFDLASGPITVPITVTR